MEFCVYNRPMKEQFVYHIKPDPMQGSILYPLNKLKHLYPDMAIKPLEKYSWRKDLLQRKIPGLDVFWNDVLHFTTLHPIKTFEALKQLRGPVGRTIQIIYVPLKCLEEARCVYFMGSDRSRNSLAEMHPEEIMPFVKSEYEEAQNVSDAQIEKWKENLQNSEPVLFFSRTRHLLYAGALDISGLVTESLAI